LAESHIKKVHKTVENGTVYLRTENKFYRLNDIEIKGSKAKVQCHGMDDGKELQFELEIKGNLLQDLVGFGLRDSKNSIFIIVNEDNRNLWFETSVNTLTEGIYKKELGKIIKTKLTAYQDIEED
jgi:hypothetical protein